MKKTTLFLKEILQTPQALADTLEKSRHPAEKVAASLLAGGARRLVAIGSGSSYFASTASAYLHNAFAPAGGTLALSASTDDFAHYPLPLAPSDAILGVSASGEIIDLLDLFEKIRSSHLLVGITNSSGSTLTTLVNHTLLMRAGKSQCPTSTKTFNTSVLALDLFWLGLLAAQGVNVSALYQELETLPGLFSRCLEEAGIRAPLLAERLLPCTRFFIFGSGPSWPVAQEVALVLHEVVGVPAEPVQSREMAHGPESLVDENTGVIAIAPSGAGQAVTREILSQCRALGGAGIEVSPDGDLVIPDGNEMLSAAVSGSPLFVLANEMALHLNRDPDHPAWEANYMRIARRGK